MGPVVSESFVLERLFWAVSLRAEDTSGASATENCEQGNSGSIGGQPGSPSQTFSQGLDRVMNGLSDSQDTTEELLDALR